MPDHTMPGTSWREIGSLPHPGRKLKTVQLGVAVVMVWLAAPELANGLGNCVPHNLRCYKSCCEASYHCPLNCTWEVGCTEDVNYTLNFRDETNRIRLEAGNATYLQFNTDKVYVLKNVTVWVESVPRNRNGPARVSENRTMLIREAIKFKALLANSTNITRSKGILTLKWPGSSGCPSSLRIKVRMRQSNDSKWIPRNCSSDHAKEKIVAVCHLEKNIPYEVQVRYRTTHWSSDWSDWSEILFVPSEILRSPNVSYSVEHLGENGQRNVNLQWERPTVEQGKVKYNLTFTMLACRQCPFSLESFSVSVDAATSYQIVLSAATYNISLEAFNVAGSSPVYSFLLSPEQNAVVGPNFLNVSLTGRNFTLNWEVEDIDFFCLEMLPLGESLTQNLCLERDETDVMTVSGILKTNRCYRFAIHGYDFTENWKTFGLKYFFDRNVSLEDSIPVHVMNQTANSADIQWKPPRALSDCPGLLKKYVICCQNEQGGNMTNYEVNVSETSYTIQNLQPKTAYRVGVWASTDKSKDNCKALHLFLTRDPDPKPMTLVLSFLFMGFFGAILSTTIIFHFCKKRVKRLLCPPLPDPANSEAVKKFSPAEKGQVHQKLGLMEPVESDSPMELLIVELSSDKQEPSVGRAMNLLGFIKGMEEEQSPKEDPVGSDEILLSEYKGQRLLSPVEESEDIVGIFHEESADGCSSLSVKNLETGNRKGILMPHLPLSFRLLDKVVVIQNMDGGFEFPCSDGASS